MLKPVGDIFRVRVCIHSLCPQLYPNLVKLLSLRGKIAVITLFRLKATLSYNIGIWSNELDVSWGWLHCIGLKQNSKTKYSQNDKRIVCGLSEISRQLPIVCMLCSLSVFSINTTSQPSVLYTGKSFANIDSTADTWRGGTGGLEPTIIFSFKITIENVKIWSWMVQPP